MKPPLTYYGGKQRMVQHILPLIPKHKLYCEPFFGGGAVFFAKEPSGIEVINDTNGELINFYKVVKTKFSKLKKEIVSSLHSRKLHRKAIFIYRNPALFSDVERAWAIFIMSHQSYCSILDSTWACGKTENTTERKFHRKKIALAKDLAKRLESVQIECRDAIEVIQTRDTRDSFFYLDPPYFNSDMGHYGGYREEDFEKLLQALSKIKGKFLLSSYPSELLKKYARKNRWFTKTINTNLSVQGAKKKRKVEVLTGNYVLKNIQQIFLH
ncbi:MAG: DNA adenine methylase [Bacteroidetes bacterium]|nr:DNA adenine methylase [Bacteroidota bacterium]